jgi:hypothetical protein
MRILLDECVPRPLRDEFPGHDIVTVPEMGWSGKKNGELLTLMSQSRFEVLLTTDKNLRHQQNLSHYGIAIVVMLAHSNRLDDLVQLVPDVEMAFSGLRPGTLVEVRR